jgi:hypothetical protein
MSNEEKVREEELNSGTMVFFPTSQIVKIRMDDNVESVQLQITEGRVKIAKEDIVEVGTAVITQESEALVYQGSTAQLVIKRYTD